MTITNTGGGTIRISGITLVPGGNEVTAKQMETLKKSKLFNGSLNIGRLVEGETAPKRGKKVEPVKVTEPIKEEEEPQKLNKEHVEKLVVGFLEMDEAKAVKAVAKATDVDVLMAIFDVEKRPKVKEALEAKLNELTK